MCRRILQSFLSVLIDFTRHIEQLDAVGHTFYNSYLEFIL